MPSWLATTLDEEMLRLRVPSVDIGPREEDMNGLILRQKAGTAVFDELGGRYLVRYLLEDQVGTFRAGSADQHWVTPTPVALQDLPFFFTLPGGNRERPYAMLLDPRAIAQIWGPRWVWLGAGIEYLLPSGFPAAAIVRGWEVQVR